jgi:hypothetical protein
MREDYTFGTFFVIPTIDPSHITASSILTFLFGVYKIFIDKKHRVISDNNGLIWRVSLRTRQCINDNWYMLHAIGQLRTFLRTNMKFYIVLICCFFTITKKRHILWEFFSFVFFLFDFKFYIRMQKSCGTDVVLESKLILCFNHCHVKDIKWPCPMFQSGKHNHHFRGKF